jgi:hypothetical protein
VRMEAASRLAELDPSSAAEALAAIARDHGVDDELRSEAAEQLAGLDAVAAARPPSDGQSDGVWRPRPPRPDQPPGPDAPPRHPQPPPVPWWVTAAAAGLERLRSL